MFHTFLWGCILQIFKTLHQLMFTLVLFLIIRTGGSIQLWHDSFILSLLTFTKKPNQKLPPCSLSSFFRSQLRNGCRRCLSPSSVIWNNLNQERRPCLWFTNDGRVPFSSEKGKFSLSFILFPHLNPFFVFSSLTLFFTQPFLMASTWQYVVSIEGGTRKVKCKILRVFFYGRCIQSEASFGWNW